MGDDHTPDDPLPDVLERLEIHQWDVLLIGDGSGCRRDGAGGWATVMIRREQPDERLVFAAAGDFISNNFAETMAYLHPLAWYTGELEARGARPRFRYVHIVTDSTHCQQRGSGAKQPRKANLGLWAAIDLLAQKGLVLKWHWLRRDQIALNRYVDQLARSARVAWEAAGVRQQLDARLGQTASDFNPG